MREICRQPFCTKNEKHLLVLSRKFAVFLKSAKVEPISQEILHPSRAVQVRVALIFIVTTESASSWTTHMDYAARDRRGGPVTWRPVKDYDRLPIAMFVLLGR
ncbi:unnamed protein product [Dovyalis caffra]|uniref:Ribosomal protein S14 n=1 Tax=Dovyalis caffra TaxID=77055 RepID=A0AAV1SVY6_9ROSI|nr:unnamed protein product [Dovyalis caffra]